MQWWEKQEQFMIQSTTANRLTGSRIARCLLMQGLGWLGIISLVSGGAALAQSPDIPESSEVASPQSASVVPEAPAAIAPAPIPAAPVPFTREFSAPAAAPLPIQQPAPMPSVVTTPQAVPPKASAPDSYEAPSAIVFSERSTGCRAVVSGGQVPGSVCGGNSERLSVGQGRNLEGGAQPRIGSLPGGLTTVQMGGISLSSTGFQGGTTPSLRDFYRRTMRPPAQLGNGNIRLIFPLSIPAAISSVFGWRIHPLTGEPRFHMGTDLAAPLGTPVLAAFAGQVAIADFLGGYGLAIALNHNKGTQQTLYGHLSEIFVKQGDQVKQGDVIGRVGNTGNSTGPHLHFEFRQLTPEGWVALDAGAQLEYGLAQLMRSLEFAQAPAKTEKANAGLQGVIEQVN